MVNNPLMTNKWYLVYNFIKYDIFLSFSLHPQILNKYTVDNYNNSNNYTTISYQTGKKNEHHNNILLYCKLGFVAFGKCDLIAIWFALLLRALINPPYIYIYTIPYVNESVAPSHPRQRQVTTTTMPTPMRPRRVKLNVNCPIAAVGPVSRWVRGTQTSRTRAAATLACIHVPGPNTIYPTMVCV